MKAVAALPPPLLRTSCGAATTLQACLAAYTRILTDLQQPHDAGQGGQPAVGEVEHTQRRQAAQHLRTAPCKALSSCMPTVSWARLLCVEGSRQPAPAGALAQATVTPGGPRVPQRRELGLPTSASSSPAAPSLQRTRRTPASSRAAQMACPARSAQARAGDAARLPTLALAARRRRRVGSRWQERRHQGKPGPRPASRPPHLRERRRQAAAAAAEAQQLHRLQGGPGAARTLQPAGRERVGTSGLLCTHARTDLPSAMAKHAQAAQRCSRTLRAVCSKQRCHAHTRPQ